MLTEGARADAALVLSCPAANASTHFIRCAGELSVWARRVALGLLGIVPLVLAAPAHAKDVREALKA